MNTNSDGLVIKKKESMSSNSEKTINNNIEGKTDKCLSISKKSFEEKLSHKWAQAKFIKTVIFVLAYLDR